MIKSSTVGTNIIDSLKSDFDHTMAILAYIIYHNFNYFCLGAHQLRHYVKYPL